MNSCNDTEEKFKPIIGYEGLYEVDNLGSIKNTKTNRILKPITNKIGYNVVNLRKNNKTINHKIHRLISIAFIPNLKNKPQVNHINGIKTDNRIENLEWATAKENSNHAQRTGLCYAGNISRGLILEKKNNKQTLDLYTGIVFDSMKQACESLNLKYSTQGMRMQRNNNTRLQYI